MPKLELLRGTALRGLAVAVAASFALLPMAASARDLMGANVGGRLNADDPRIALTPPPPLPPPPPAPTTVHDILAKAAADQGVDPNLLFAVSYWESSWRQDQVSSEGAIGLLQVMPKTAATAGPMMLHRNVDLNNPVDNAEMGAALLKDLLGKYDTRTALAAYYQGEPAITSGHYAPDTWHYADGILALEGQIAAGKGPSFP